MSRTLLLCGHPAGRPLHSAVSRGFDTQGRLTAVTNALGQVTSFNYGPNDELLAVTRSSGARLTYGYNALGQRTAITNPSGTAWHFDYDGNGQLKRGTDPLGGEPHYTHDALDRLVTMINANGTTVQRTYTVDGQPQSLTLSSGESCPENIDLWS